MSGNFRRWVSGGVRSGSFWSRLILQNAQQHLLGHNVDAHGPCPLDNVLRLGLCGQRRGRELRKQGLGVLAISYVSVNHVDQLLGPLAAVADLACQRATRGRFGVWVW